MNKSKPSIRQVEIPEVYLLTIAVHGNMGSGELPDLMKAWALKECKRAGLEKRVKALQEERLKELAKRLRNTLGDDFMDKVDVELNKVSKLLTQLK